MRGTITKITGRIKEGKAYTQLTIQEDNETKQYQCYDEKLFKELQTGNTIEYEYYTSKTGNNYIIAAKKSNNQEPIKQNTPSTTNNNYSWPTPNPEKDNNILKQVCLKIAAQNLSGLGMSNLEWAKKIVINAKVLYNEIKDSGWLK